jgi:hypothetical protein
MVKDKAELASLEEHLWPAQTALSVPTPRGTTRIIPVRPQTENTAAQMRRPRSADDLSITF